MTRDDRYRLLRDAGAPDLTGSGAHYFVRMLNDSDHYVEIQVRANSAPRGATYAVMGRGVFSLVNNVGRTVLEAAAVAAREAHAAAFPQGVPA